MKTIEKTEDRPESCGENVVWIKKDRDRHNEIARKHYANKTQELKDLRIAVVKLKKLCDINGIFYGNLV